jgi:hypothetical protein
MGLTQKLGTIPLAILTDASNNVGIGAAPSGSYKLEVTGTGRFTGNLNIDGERLTIGGTSNNAVINNIASVRINIDCDNNDTAETFTIGKNQVGIDNNNVLFRVQENGNVGIGTSSPSKLLHLYNTAGTDVMLVESTQVFSTIAFKSSTNSSTVTIGIDGGGAAAFENKLTTGAMSFVTNGSERMRISSTGAIFYSNTGNQTNLLTYSSNQDKGITNFYQAQNFPSSNNYTRILDIVSSGDATGGGAMRFLTSAANTAPAERMLITSGGQISVNISTASTTALFNLKAPASSTVWSFGPNNFNATNIFRVENSDTTGVYLTSGNTSWTANSDIRLKDIINPITKATELLSTLNPVYFTWKSDNTKKENIGLIAQDVEKAFPQVIDVNPNGMLGVRYQELVPVLVKAIQELNERLNKAGL